MLSNHPKEQKSLGRLVANFDWDVWKDKAQDIVYDGNWAKFNQSKDLQKLLLDTEGTTLVEASPKDTVWGIGLAANDPLALDRSTWKGTNWLGQVLTAVRTNIIQSKINM